MTSTNKYQPNDTQAIFDVLFPIKVRWMEELKLNQSFNHTTFVVALWLLMNDKPVTQRNIRLKLVELGVSFNQSSLSERFEAHKWPTFASDRRFVTAYDFTTGTTVRQRTLVPEQAHSYVSKLFDERYKLTKENGVLKVQIALYSLLSNCKRKTPISEVFAIVASDEHLQELREILCEIGDTSVNMYDKRMKVFIQWFSTYSQYSANWPKLYHALDKVDGKLFPRLVSTYVKTYSDGSTYERPIDHRWIGTKDQHAMHVQVGHMFKLLKRYPRSKTAGKQAEVIQERFVDAENRLGVNHTTELCEDMQYACMLIENNEYSKDTDNLVGKLYSWLKQPKV